MEATLLFNCHSPLDAEFVGLLSFRTWCGICSYILHIPNTATPIPTFPQGKGFVFFFSSSSSSSFSFPASFPSPKGWKLHFYLIVIPHLMRNLLVSCHSALDAESVHTFSISPTPQHPSPPSLKGRSFQVQVQVRVRVRVQARAVFYGIAIIL